MKVLEIIRRAEACIEKLPARTIERSSERSYRKTFRRMWHEPVLDALVPGRARKSYYHRRAALHTVSRILLQRFKGECMAAAERNDIETVQRAAACLVRLLDRIEPALERDPPLADGQQALRSPSSRWRAAEGSQPKRDAGSKKYVLGLLPPDWDERLWQAAVEKWNKPADQQKLDALAAALLAPVRPEEFVPGDRPHGRSEGIVIELPTPRRLHIINATVKHHRGRYGAGIVTVTIDPIEAGGAAAYLAGRCAAAGGRLVIAIGSKNAARKALGRLGESALPECEEAITPNVCRNQVIADFKATLGAGAEVAAAAGQGTDRTQAGYGRVEHGRKRRGLIGVESTRPPRTGNVARAHALAAKRKAATPKRKPATPKGNGDGSDN
jgi:hypothetical protein